MAAPFTLRSLRNLALVALLLVVQSSRDRYRPAEPPASMAEMLVDQASQTSAPEQKLALLGAATRIAPRLVRARNERALLLERLDHLEDALRAIDRALELEPTSGTLHFNRANILQALARPQDALEAYTRSIRLEPRPASYLNRAAAYLATAQRALALADLRQAAKFDPQLPGLKQLIARLTREQDGGL